MEDKEMKENDSEKKPVKKLVGYLAAPVPNPYLPNNDNFMHLKKTFTETNKLKGGLRNE